MHCHWLIDLPSQTCHISTWLQFFVILGPWLLCDPARLHRFAANNVDTIRISRLSDLSEAAPDLCFQTCCACTGADTTQPTDVNDSLFLSHQLQRSSDVACQYVRFVTLHRASIES